MSTVEKGVFLAKSGDRDGAYAFLKAAATIEPENEEVWLWLSRTATDRDESNAYFKKALELDQRQGRPRPDHRSTSGLAGAKRRGVDGLEMMQHAVGAANRSELASKVSFQPVGRPVTRPARPGLPKFALAALGIVVVVALYFTVTGRIGRTSSSAGQPTITLGEDPFTAGVALYKEGKYGEAIPQFQQALVKDGQKGETHLFLGLAYFQGPRQIQEADGELQKAIALLKDSASLSTAHFNLGIIREEQGRSDQACKEYAEAVRLNPANQQAAEARSILDKEGSCSQ
ncbi:MAG: tetratricopeptide repeat protein [Chloroflexi bacterium]|nr:tetratricopeptide repeat protein [Chloroflexota bacterium]